MTRFQTELQCVLPRGVPMPADGTEGETTVLVEARNHDASRCALPVAAGTG